MKRFENYNFLVLDFLEKKLRPVRRLGGVRSWALGSGEVAAHAQTGPIALQLRGVRTREFFLKADWRLESADGSC